MRVLGSVVIGVLLLGGCGGGHRPATLGSAAWSTATVQRPQASFRVPTTWEEDDQDGVTHVIGGVVPDQWVQFRARQDALVQWYVTPPASSAVTQEQIRGAVDAGLEAMRGITSDELTFMRNTAGLGCRSGAAMVGEPASVLVGEGYGLRFEYTCTSASGPAHSIALAAYGWDGRKHNLTVSAVETYWDRHAAQFEALADSFRVTG